MEKLIWTDINGGKRELPIDIDQIINQISSPGFIRGRLHTQGGLIDALLPPDIGKDSRGDYPFKNGIDFSKFEDPKKAEQVINTMLGVAGGLWGTISANISVQDLGGSVARFNEKLPGVIASWRRDAAPQIAAAMGGYQAVDPNAPNYGAPITTDMTGQPGTGTTQTTTQQTQGGSISTSGQSFLDWKQANPNGTYDQWRTAPPSTTTQPGGTNQQGGTPTGTGDQGYNTFLGARQRGFVGDFAAWVAAGRPTGAVGTVTTPPKTEVAGGQPGTTTTTPGGQPNDNTQRALDIINNSSLDEATKALFRTTVGQWDPTKEVNMQNVLDQFKIIKENTIDPKFREMATVFGNDLQNQISENAMARDRELEIERTASGQSIRQAKEGLEKSGMTFTGKGIEQLGAESAYAQQPSDTVATPTQTPFGGMFYEGNVNQANRLMSTGSSARYRNQMQQLGRTAEDILGSGISGYNIPGFNPSGVSQGSMGAGQQQDYINALNQLAGQQSQNNQYQLPVNVFQ